MDHAEAIETEGRAPQNVIEENPFLHENSTVPTPESIADGGDAMYVDGQGSAPDEADASMDADSAGVDEGGLDLLEESGLASAATVAGEPSNTTASLMSTLAGDTTGHCPVSVAGASASMDQPAVGAANKNTMTTEISEPESYIHPLTPQPPANPMGTLSEQSSFDQGQDISVDEDDTHSDKAKSVDARLEDAKQSELDIPPPQDQHQSGQANERAPLEHAYGPYVHPTDTCLADARERLHVALEQTRLLRASFTEQAYERYRCVMKPVPDSLNEIVGRINSNPKQAGLFLHEQEHEIKVEKYMEKTQAQQAGVGLEELAYFGEGLHLVLLPEDDFDGTEIDPAQFPHRGPTDPETGERREEISAAAAATTEQVFDRIRRIRAIRMGADIVPAAGITAPVPQMTRNLGQDQEGHAELFPPGFVTGHQSSSPAPSVDSDAAEDSSQGLLQHLLTLAPDAEGARPDGGFTAVQSALIARGVGMNEMKRDLRINPLCQRMFQSNYFSSIPSHKFLPLLLGPHQLYRLKAADARKVLLESKTGARESINSVVEAICSSVSKRMSLKDDNKSKNGSNSGGEGSSDEVGPAMGEEHSATEIGLLHRLRSLMLSSSRDKDVPAAISNSTSCVGKSFADSDTGEIDPLLAFSVMRAVGLVRRKEGNGENVEHKSQPDRNSENAYAQTLGLDYLMSLESVSKFFHTNSASANGRKRRLPGTDSAIHHVKKSKVESSITVEEAAKEAVYQIRGGGRHDEVNGIESNALPNKTGEMKKQKKNGASQTAKNNSSMPGPSLAGYAGFDPLYSAMSQVPHGENRSQSVIAAATSRQLLQHQLGVPPDPYHTAALAHQLALPPIGSHLHSLPSSDLADFYLRNGLAGSSDWSALRAANPNTGADVLAQHPHLRTSLGLLSQMNLGLSEHEAARAMLLRDHHNAAAARAQEAVTAARYQAALSSINPQNRFGFASSSLSHPHSNETQSIPSLPALHAKQQKETSSKELKRQRALSLSENSTHNKTAEEVNGIEFGESDQVPDRKRPASAPPSPQCLETKSTTNNGGSSTDDSSEKKVSGDNASILERVFTVPTPPKGLHPEVADLIAHAKFHEAHSLSQQKADESEALLVDYLLSVGEVNPIPKELIKDTLVKKLGSSNYQLRLHEFVGSSTSASGSRNVIIAVISIWIWVEQRDCFKPSFDLGKIEANSSFKWLINLAVDKSLSALATFFDFHPSGKSDGPKNEETPNKQVAAITSQSLAKKVFLDFCADATFPILDDLLELLDSLRTDTLRAKTQERVLLAALASRCGNMSEAFSNAYVSSIVRAGVALGHENVCEIGQDEECRASTMLPYDFFHDNVGVWEEPCRPTTGYRDAVGGDQLKKQAHARSVIQKSMKMLQNRFNLKGGISDGGPYFTAVPTNASAASTPTTVPHLVRTSSGSLKRRGSLEPTTVCGTGTSDTVFNPDHSVVPMVWNPNEIENFPYGLSDHDKEAPTGMSESKKKKISQSKVENPRDQAASLALKYRSTDELEWEDVANMFFHGGSTRNIDINYNFGSNDHLGKKTIFAPFVSTFDQSLLKVERDAENEASSDEDISDETVLQRHQDVLDEMKLKLDSAFETRKQHQQPRGRKRKE